MFLQNRKKMVLLLGATIVTALMTQSFNYTQQQQERKLQNIKVFPSTMTYREVDHAMDQFKAALGVKCNFCHAPDKDNPRRMDMPSDANPMKNVAREMLRMTMEMNEKYMASIKHPESDTTQIQHITCNTCHRGATKPFGQPLVAPGPGGGGQKPAAPAAK
ncbi:MAG: c-type cytochrome [Bacteroidota bacterium]|nr:c-type cytochrome [Bacteroidota bacterium]